MRTTGWMKGPNWEDVWTRRKRARRQPVPDHKMPMDIYFIRGYSPDICILLPWLLLLPFGGLMIRSACCLHSRKPHRQLWAIPKPKRKRKTPTIHPIHQVPIQTHHLHSIPHYIPPNILSPLGLCRWRTTILLSSSSDTQNFVPTVHSSNDFTFPYEVDYEIFSVGYGPAECGGHTVELMVEKGAK
jgi:hypothetical protein